MNSTYIGVGCLTLIALVAMFRLPPDQVSNIIIPTISAVAGFTTSVATGVTSGVANAAKDKVKDLLGVSKDSTDIK